MYQLEHLSSSKRSSVSRRLRRRNHLSLYWNKDWNNENYVHCARLLCILIKRDFQLEFRRNERLKLTSNVSAFSYFRSVKLD